MKNNIHLYSLILVSVLLFSSCQESLKKEIDTSQTGNQITQEEVMAAQQTWGITTSRMPKQGMKLKLSIYSAISGIRMEGCASMFTTLHYPINQHIRFNQSTDL
ncbi:MAG: hypothetical protein IH596_03690 [Bacteroidales bacterium]|nr:hypothetical protein [Bacteroidales bacterium]